jgi:tetrahydromethanopterin S-methyltransferase subunit A
LSYDARGLLDPEYLLFEGPYGMGDIAGRLCEIFIPINDAYFIGKGKTIAICVLSSMDFLQAIARSEDMMERILIVGRLLSENKGIDSLVRFT